MVSLRTKPVTMVRLTGSMLPSEADSLLVLEREPQVFVPLSWPITMHTRSEPDPYLPSKFKFSIQKID